MRRSRLIPVLLALSLGSSSCWFAKKKTVKVFVPPPVQKTPRPLPTLPEVSAGPVIDAKVVWDPELNYPVILPTLPPPPAPVKRPVVVAPKQTPPPQPPEPVPTPRLGQIFTSDQLRDYNRALDDSLDRVKRALGVIERKGLNTEQAETVERIRTFQKQAEQAREQDLVTAVNLARRADVLAQDLLQRLP